MFKNCMLQQDIAVVMAIGSMRLTCRAISCRFNLRVLECRLAAMLLAKLLSAHSTATSGSSGHVSSSSSSEGSCAGLDWRAVNVLKAVEAALLKFAAAQQPPPAATQAQAQLQWAVERLLPQASYTLQQVN